MLWPLHCARSLLWFVTALLSFLSVPLWVFFLALTRHYHAVPFSLSSAPPPPPAPELGAVGHSHS